jgi:hypothetical protein
MAPTYKSAEYWRREHPGVALILENNVGRKKLIKALDELPLGKWRLLGIIGIGY